MMLDRIKNSFLSRCLLVFMTGYFLISSINVSRSLFPENTDVFSVHSVEGMTLNLIKKIFQCEGISEELEEFGAKESKTLKLAKGLALQDYLLPVDASWLKMHLVLISSSRNYRSSPVFEFDFHGTIQVPPPKLVA